MLRDFVVHDYFENVNGGVGITPRSFSGRLTGRMSMDAAIDAVVDKIVLANNTYDPTWYFDLQGRQKFALFSPYPCENWRHAHLEEESIGEKSYAALLLRVQGSYALTRNRLRFSREGVYVFQVAEKRIEGRLVDFLASRWGCRHEEEEHLFLKELTSGILVCNHTSSQKPPEERRFEVR